MRTIAHISDLHFGRTDPAVLKDLHAAVTAAKPDLVAISGDLTQRARTREFQEAQAFLATLPQPQIAVPGNHDVPLYDVLRRWLMPLTRFRRYITGDLAPFYADAEIAVLGLNTARAFTFKNGRLNRAQMSQVRACLAPLADRVVKVVVTHHPFALPEQASRQARVGRAKMAMQAFASCKVDLVLSGHLHASQAITSETLYAGARATLLIQAGTATSSRRRDEPNAFNLLRIGEGAVTVERHTWRSGGGFSLASAQAFRRGERGWSAAQA